MVSLSWKLLLILALLAAGVTGAAPAGAQTAGPVDSACVQVSPSQLPCTFADKQAEALAAECRRLGFSDAQCTLPLGKEVTDAAVREYQESWLHRTVRFQRKLGDPLPILRSQFLGTHNSFNSVNDSPTISHSDSNQQLGLDQQLDIDIRSLELDVHYIPRPELGGASAVTVCHGRGPDQMHAGCTNEPLLTTVLPRITTWLNAPAHRDDVVLLYLEDELGSPQGFADTVQQLEAGLVGPSGRSLIYHPAATSGTCTDLPLAVSREAVRAAGAQVVLVGNCRAGWKSTVFGWDTVHVESGSTPAYRPFPACDATYGRDVYDTKLVRYYEDSTVVAQAVSPGTSPADAEAERLTPAKVGSMVQCGVNLFGFDQILPGDGRLDATVWSWVRDAPDAQDGTCAIQRTDSRWVTKPCAERRPAACLTGQRWSTTAPVTWGQAAAACAAAGGSFALPRTGYENQLLSRAGGAGETWLAYRLDEGAAAGPPGPAGPAGSAGPAGPAGAGGQDGHSGTNATDGTNGTDGKNGVDGKDRVTATSTPTAAPRLACSTARTRVTCRLTRLAGRGAGFSVLRGSRTVGRGRLSAGPDAARFTVRVPRGGTRRYVVRVVVGDTVLLRTVSA